MAMTVTYTTLNGEIILENRNGVERDYMPDPQGNTLALLDDTQTKTDTFTYWPYGEVKSRTGTTPTPFQYIGTRGYYQDSSTKTYVRARYLDTQMGRWMTVDPIGYTLILNSYCYSLSSPVKFIDPTGLEPAIFALTSKYKSGCRARTDSYCRHARLEGTTPALNCICRVSNALCEIIEHGPIWPKFNEKNIKWIDCVNKCMFDHWFLKDTKQWHSSDSTCNKCGHNSPTCCYSMTHAEQSGYTNCLPKCAKFGPPVNVGPVNGGFKNRWKNAILMCCNGAPWGDPLPKSDVGNPVII